MRLPPRAGLAATRTAPNQLRRAPERIAFADAWVQENLLMRMNTVMMTEAGRTAPGGLRLHPQCHPTGPWRPRAGNSGPVEGQVAQPGGGGVGWRWGKHTLRKRAIFRPYRYPGSCNC